MNMERDTLAGWYLLDSVKGFGPGKCRTVHESGIDPIKVIDDPTLLPIGSKTGEKLVAGLQQIDGEQRERARYDATRDLEQAEKLGVAILGYRDPHYPSRLYESNYPVPFLFVRGDLSALQRTAVACVGSRAIRPPYSTRQAQFAEFAASHGYTIVSGFATGADIIAHDATVRVDGRTVAVMPSGLDLVFPPEHRSRWQEWLNKPGVAFVSDFRFGRRADALALRKRNKLIVALASGVLIGQSDPKGGAMNAFRFALEQRKPVATFESDDDSDAGGNAQIAATEKVPATTFPRTVDAPDQWNTWLASLKQ